MVLVCFNHVGESPYGESRLQNVDKFTRDELKSLLSFQSDYKETEFDIEVMNTALTGLEKVAPNKSKVRFGTYENVTLVKFKTHT